ncbi:MAG: glycerophosphoryl diester phosphodiesterase membrane domain-containing protein, partial [bacterium]
MFKRFRDYYNVYETAIPRIFRYQLLTKPILIPMNFLFNKIVKWLLEVTGIGTITSANFLSFLLHPASLLMILLFLVMAVFYTVFDVN